ncbi:MAG: rRNA adenine N-6-methyltransferase family protein, partial [Thermostichales cyanobacterium BF3_bins_165]
VPPQAFYPPPQVHSAVLALQPRPYPHPPRDPRWLETLVTLGFRSRRKTLANSLQSLIPKDQLSQALAQLGRDPFTRGEALSVAEWVSLSDMLLDLRASLLGARRHDGGIGE